MRVPERVQLIRIVATPAALDSVEWPNGTIVLRVAPDEVLAAADVVLASLDELTVARVSTS